MQLNEPLANTDRPAQEDRVPARNWYALLILTLISACHFLDRTMISIIVEPVRREFHLSDSQIGLMTGLAYGATFAIAGIPIGLLIDRMNRVRLLAALVAIWSGMTALAGFATNYLHLLITRMGVGASEAGGPPTSLSLISDLFPPSRRSTAVGYFFLATGMGAVTSVFIGGYMTAHFGWRTSMMVAGIPGIVLAVLCVLTVREPRRGATEAHRGRDNVKAASVSTVLRYVTGNAAMRNLVLGVCFAAGGVSTIAAWLPALMMRVHGFNIKEAGFSVALAAGIFSSVGSFIGGFLSDRLARANARRRMDLAMGSCLCAAAFAVLALNVKAGTPFLTLALLCATMMCIFVAFPAAYGNMLGLTAPNMRGTTSASMQVFSNLVGYGVGPLAVGMLSDLYSGASSLRLAIMTGAGVCLPLAALCFARSASACDRLLGRRPL
ncbi:spinster family MFS transporter [Massilia putida]|uniref:spinster family MFS transporter n=1 Tax=Massilia putida TaxID=1141883 RepID=UPI0009531CBE|nr:MFS transporter [Massilia putida]